MPLIVFFAFLGLCLPQVSHALSAPLAVEEEPDEEAASPFPAVRIGGVLWGAWSLDVSHADPDAGSPNGANRFEVLRSYVNVEARLSESVSLRITPDLVLARSTDGNIDGSRLLRLKYAYLTFSPLGESLRVRVLMQQTPYVDFSNKVWGYRVLGRDYLQIFTNTHSSDLGASVLGAVGSGLLEYQVMVANGEGYSEVEPTDPLAGKYKDIAARLTFAPFVDGTPLLRRLRLTAFGQYGIREKVDDEHLERIRAVGLLTWEPGFAVLGVGGGWSRDDSLGTEGVERQGTFLFTSFGWLDLPARFRALARFDLSDPEGDAVSHSRLIAGLAYRFTDEVQVIADWQHFGFRPARGASPEAIGDTLALHFAATF